jgi:hypothetical protein
MYENPPDDLKEKDVRRRGPSTPTKMKASPCSHSPDSRAENRSHHGGYPSPPPVTAESGLSPSGKNKAAGSREKKQQRGGGRGSKRRKPKQWQEKTGNCIHENPPDASDLKEDVSSADCLHRRTYKLYNPIPPNLRDLENLEELDARSMDLRSIPEVFFSNACKFRLTLVDLDLSVNSIETIPPGIRSLTSLRRLNLSENQIRTVPDDLFELVGLEYLNLAHNKLYMIPDSIRKLPCLTRLDVRDNHLRDFPSFCFEALRSANLANNELQSFDVGLQCTEAPLMELDLSHNELCSVPDNINELCNLEKLYVIITTTTSTIFTTTTTITTKLRHLYHLHHHHYLLHHHHECTSSSPPPPPNLHLHLSFTFTTTSSITATKAP